MSSLSSDPFQRCTSVLARSAGQGVNFREISKMWSISEYIGSADSTVTSLGLNGSANSLIELEVLYSNLSNQAPLLGFQVLNQDLPGQDRSFSMLDVYGLAESITELYQEIFSSSLPNRPFPLVMGLIGSAESLDEVFEKLEDLCCLIDQALTA